jgi:hypothetical protein
LRYSTGAVEATHLCSPVLCEIVPAGIRGLDQSNLLRACPSLDLRFTGDGATNVRPLLDPHKTGAIVLCGEAPDEVVHVLEDPAVKAIRHARVERTALAGHDIHPEALSHGLNESMESGRTATEKIEDGWLKSLGLHRRFGPCGDSSLRSE